MTRIIDLGADALTPAGLRAAIERAQTDSRILRSVRAMRDAVRATGGATAAMDAIGRLIALPPAALRAGTS